MNVKMLVSKAKLGDKDALLKLVLNQKDSYYKLAYVYLRDKEDSMDAMEDMIVILYEKIKQLKDDEAFYSWSKTILVNCCKKVLKKKKKVIYLDKYEEQSYIEKYESKEQIIDINQYLGYLNPLQQEAIKLRYLLDMDYRTMAKVLKVSEGTVKSRISVGLKKLREKFGGDYNGEYRTRLR